jgi:fucose permease
MSFLHSFWGLATNREPLISRTSARRTATGAAGTIRFSIIQFALAAVMILSLPLWKRVPHAVVEQQQAEEPIVIGNREAIKQRGVLAAVLSFFFYCAGETTTGLWAATYFVSVRGIEPSVAAGWGSLFFFGIMGGRMISGLLAMRVKEKTLVRWGIGIAALGAVVACASAHARLPTRGALL